MGERFGRERERDVKIVACFLFLGWRKKNKLGSWLVSRASHGQKRKKKKKN